MGDGANCFLRRIKLFPWTHTFGIRKDLSPGPLIRG